MFRGANKLTLDAKGRMVMPTRYRERLQERCGGKLVVTVDKDQCLLIYPLPDWEEVERKLMRLPAFNAQARQLQRLMVGNAARMRESSFTLPVFLSSGTLKSTRMKTRFPAMSSCSMDLIMAFARGPRPEA